MGLERGSLLAAVFLISSGFTVGSVSAAFALETTVEDPEQSLNCSSGENDRLKGSQPAVRGVSPQIKSPDTKVSYTVGAESIEVTVDAISRHEGFSMRPSIFTGNTVLLEQYDGSQKLEVGTIIRYRTESGFVIHRVKENNLDSSGIIVTQGDNNAQDEIIKEYQVTHIATGVLYT